MHNRIDPSFFFTKRTGAPQGDELGLIKPFASSSSNWVLNSFISVGASLKPGSSSGKTSGYSEMTGRSSIFSLGSSIKT
ncbi:hypothetical protein Hanom_Chr01g00064201 [Helianthus anomalus]